MSLIVQKYGGTSVGRRRAHPQRRAPRRARARRRGDDVVVVVSAMAGETNRLLGAGARRWRRSPTGARSTCWSSTGEQVTTALLAIALHRTRRARRARSSATRSASTPTAPSARRASAASTATRMRAALGAGRVVGRRRLPGRRRATTTSPRSAAAARDTSGGRARRRAQGRRVRDLHRRRRRLHQRPAHLPARAQARRASRTTRCSSSRASAPRCCRSARSSSPSATACRVHVRSSFNDSEGTWVVPEEAKHGRRPGVRRHLRSRPGQDHPARRARPARASRRRIFGADRRRRTSSST